MKTAFRKIWRDLWNNKGRTALVVLSIGVGVLALGMITASNALMDRQMTKSQAASRLSDLAARRTSRAGRVQSPAASRKSPAASR